MSTLYYRATKDFTFGGVAVRRGQPVPCHRKPWSTLLDFGHMYVEPVTAEPEPCFHDICDGEPECLLPADPEDGAR